MQFTKLGGGKRKPNKKQKERIIATKKALKKCASSLACSFRIAA
jgi:hypothetical protein